MSDPNVLGSYIRDPNYQGVSEMAVVQNTGTILDGAVSIPYQPYGAGVSSGSFILGNNTNPMNNKMNIFRKLNDVMTNMNWVGKDGKVNGGGANYAYATEAAFIAEVRPLFVQFGLVIYPTAISNNETTVTDKQNGGKSFLTTITVKYIIGDVDTGETIEVEVMGQGSDSGDKGVYKALTGAFKYALRQALMIGTGDDPEATDDDGQDTSKPQRKVSSFKTTEESKVEEKPKLKKVDQIAYYQEKVREGLQRPELANAKDILKKYKINVDKLPEDEKTLQALYSFVRETILGKSVAETTEILSTLMGS